MIVLKHSLWVVALSFLMSACSIFGPIKIESMKEYLVDTVPMPSRAHRHTERTLVVAMPTVNAIYASKEMVYSTYTHGMSYFAKNRWAETPAQMLQPLIIQSLQNMHYYKAVAPSKGLGRFDVILNTQLLQFHQVFFGHCSEFRMTLRAQLINISTGKIIASKEFTAVEPAPQAGPYGGVLAANKAVSRILSELSAWNTRH